MMVSNYKICEKRPRQKVLILWFGLICFSIGMYLVYNITFQPANQATYPICSDVSFRSARMIWNVIQENGSLPKWGNLTSSREIQLIGSGQHRPVVHQLLLDALHKNIRPIYNNLATSLESPTSESWSKELMNGKYSPLRLATFNNVWCDAEGWIVHAETCQAIKNGGCEAVKEFTIPSTSIWGNPPPSVPNVVSIAGRWTSGIWHFPFEALVGLANLPTQYDDTLIHISSINAYVLQWLDIVGISQQRVISGTIHATNLVVPEMGKCGSPAPYQVEWLRIKTQNALPSTISERRTVLLVKRTKTRAIKNFVSVEKITRIFAQKHKFDVLIHDDASLPPLKEQLVSFRAAAVIIAPHGAGLVNLISSEKGTPVIEFIDPDNVNICYMRLSSLLGHKYHGIPVVGSVVDEETLQLTLNTLVM